MSEAMTDVLQLLEKTCGKPGEPQHVVLHSAMAYLLNSTAQTVNPTWTGGPADSTPAVIAAYA
jgi:hypothetical protein